MANNLGRLGSLTEQVSIRSVGFNLQYEPEDRYETK